MAVKVIQYGKIRCKCPNCASLLEAQKSDFVTVYTGRWEEKDFITCPVCGKAIESCYWKEYTE